LISIPLSPESLAGFRGENVELGNGEIVVSHVMVKNPDLMIERPYTPVNDVEKDGEVRIVVKKVKGGEVGR
jgi:cytochrome-b5 reductase